MSVENRLSLSIAADHSSLTTSAMTILHLVATIDADGPAAESERPPLTVVFALDVSHSMTGAPLRQVKRSTQRILELLRPDDRAGVVAFSQDAQLIAPVAELSRETRTLMGRSIEKIRVRSSTNIEAGLRLAYRILPERRPHERVVVLLLSDGMPNVGIADPQALSQLARTQRPQVTTSTLGFGAQHDEPILSGAAEGGAGTYHYIRDPALAQVEFAAAVGAQGDVVADHVSLSVKPERGVQIIRVLGHQETRFDEEGLVIPLPDMIKDSRYRVAVRLQVEAGPEAGPGPVAVARLRHRAAGQSVTHLQTEHLLIRRTGRPSRMAQEPLHIVLLLRAEEERREARDLADRGLFTAAAQKLRTAAAMIVAAPGVVPGDGSELAEALAQLEDDALLFEQQPDAAQYAEFRRGQRLGRGGNLDGTPLGSHSQALLADATGPVPDAMIVDLAQGRSFPLEAMNVLGRSPDCHVHLPYETVSRRAARLVAQGGQFWIEDLGSTNGLSINGRRISRRQLQDGDEFSIGSAHLKYVSVA